LNWLCALVRQYRLAELRELAGSGLVNWTPEELSSWRDTAKMKEKAKRGSKACFWIPPSGFAISDRREMKKSKLR